MSYGFTDILIKPYEMRSNAKKILKLTSKQDESQLYVAMDQKAIVIVHLGGSVS